MLPLDAEEQAEFDQHLAEEGLGEKEAVMEMTTSWQRKGREEGREALADAVLVFLRRQVGALEAGHESQVRGLSMPDLQQLSRALLQFHDVSDLEAWLARQ